MRPDRLVVGEVRGAEVVEMLAALNTGHAGGCGTVHANSAADVPARRRGARPGRRAGPQAAAHSQLAAAVDVVLHLARGSDGVRRAAPGRGAAARRPTGWSSSRWPSASTWTAGRQRSAPAGGRRGRVGGSGR